MSIIVDDTFYESAFPPRSFNSSSTGHCSILPNGGGYVTTETRDELIKLYCNAKNIAHIKPINELKTILGYKVIDEIERDEFLLEDGRVVTRAAFSDKCLNENCDIFVRISVSKKGIPYINSLYGGKTSKPPRVVSQYFTQQEINELYRDPYTPPKIKKLLFDHISLQIPTKTGMIEIRGKNLTSLHTLLTTYIDRRTRFQWSVNRKTVYQLPRNKYISKIAISSLLHDLNPIFEKYDLPKIDPPFTPVPNLWRNSRELVLISGIMRRTQTKDGLIKGVTRHKRFSINNRRLYSLKRLDEAYEHLLVTIEQLQKKCDKYHLNHVIPIPTRSEFEQIVIDKIAMANKKDIVTTKSGTDEK